MKDWEWEGWTWIGAAAAVALICVMVTAAQKRAAIDPDARFLRGMQRCATFIQFNATP